MDNSWRYISWYSYYRNDRGTSGRWIGSYPYGIRYRSEAGCMRDTRYIRVRAC